MVFVFSMFIISVEFRLTFSEKESVNQSTNQMKPLLANTAIVICVVQEIVFYGLMLMTKCEKIG